MASEIQIPFAGGKTVYFMVVNRIGQFWNTVTVAFEAYNAANIANYAISATQVSATQSMYLGTFPSSIPAGVYGILGKQQLGASVAETDLNIGGEDFQWNGSVELPLSDLVTSGQFAQSLPITIYRGQMVKNFPFKLVSSLDHVTVFTSGLCSGSISRDPVSGSVFVGLQSGIFSEIGNGWYSVTLTSGDLLANTVALDLQAMGVSGGSSDVRSFSFVLQRTSGQ